MSQYDSQFEENLYNLRREKLAQITALGQQAYPNSFAFTHTIPELLPLGLDADGQPKPAETLEAEHITASVAGRILAIRLQGKAGFATLQQGGQRLQIYVRKDDVGEPAFELYKLLDLGDHIGVTGTLMRTRTGELTLKAGALSPERPALTFLTKAMLPLPDKFSGLGDIELRYRRRYLDLFTDTGDTSEPTTEAVATDTASGYPEASASGLIGSQKEEGALAPEVTGSALKGTGFSPSGGSSGLQATEMPPKEVGALAPEGTGSALKRTGFSPSGGSSGLQATEMPPKEAGALALEGHRLPARTVFVKRAAILRSIRNFFDTRGYLEVETPMLHTIAGGAAARTFTTHHNAEDMELILRIAPELHLKRLVVGGLDRVYEINRNFRNEGIDRTHNPEFTMLEFYQAYANYHDLMDITEELIKQVAMDVNGTTITHFNGNEIDLSKWTKLSMREAIIKYWPEYEFGQMIQIDDFDDFESLHRALSNRIMTLHPILSEKMTLLNSKDLAALYMSSIDETLPSEEIARRKGAADLLWLRHELEESRSVGKTIAEIFEMLAEPHLIQPTIIYDFPLAVSPLSKVKPDEPDWVERFEFYIGGFEIGNAFSELNDPDDQLRRFEAQVADKDPESMAAVDHDYVRALGYGLPPTAGEGIGIDRLTMVLTGSRTIRDVILFPLMRPTRPSEPETPTS